MKLIRSIIGHVFLVVAWVLNLIGLLIGGKPAAETYVTQVKAINRKLKL